MAARSSSSTPWTRVKCLFNRHRPVAREVEWDGAHYVGHCVGCGARIRRRSSKTWRRDWLKPSPAE